MKKEHIPAIIGKPYPVACGHGYRCYDGWAWHDCDKNGKVIEREK